MTPITNPSPPSAFMMYRGATGDTIAGGATEYVQLTNDGTNAAELYLTEMTMAMAGRMDNLHAWISSAVGAGETFTITIRLNGAPTALTCQIGGAVDLEAEDLVNGFNFQRGDKITVEFTASAGANARSGMTTVRIS